MRICIECEKEYTDSEFHKNSQRKDGLNTRCKYCVNEMNRLKYKDVKGFHKHITACESCYFVEMCKARIWNMNFWPYCMRRG